MFSLSTGLSQSNSNDAKRVTLKNLSQRAQEIIGGPAKRMPHMHPQYLKNISALRPTRPTFSCGRTTLKAYSPSVNVKIFDEYFNVQMREQHASKEHHIVLKKKRIEFDPRKRTHFADPPAAAAERSKNSLIEVGRLSDEPRNSDVASP